MPNFALTKELRSDVHTNLFALILKIVSISKAEKG